MNIFFIILVGKKKNKENIFQCKRIIGWALEVSFTGNLATKESGLFPQPTVSGLLRFSRARLSQVWIQRDCFKFTLNSWTRRSAGGHWDSLDWNGMRAYELHMKWYVCIWNDMPVVAMARSWSTGPWGHATRLTVLCSEPLKPVGGRAQRGDLSLPSSSFFFQGLTRGIWRFLG